MSRSAAVAATSLSLRMGFCGTPPFVIPEMQSFFTNSGQYFASHLNQSSPQGNVLMMHFPQSLGIGVGTGTPFESTSTLKPGSTSPALPGSLGHREGSPIA